MKGELAIERRARVLTKTLWRGELRKFRTPGRRGAADNLLILTDLPMLFVEFKDPGEGEQSAAQARFSRDVQRLGQTYWLVDDLDEYARLVEQYIAAYPRLRDPRRDGVR